MLSIIFLSEVRLVTASLDIDISIAPKPQQKRQNIKFCLLLRSHYFKWAHIYFKGKMYKRA